MHISPGCVYVCNVYEIALWKPQMARRMNYAKIIARLKPGLR